MDRFDINGKKLNDGDVIDIHQTVNGQNQFVVLTIDPLDIRYAYNLRQIYEYDMVELLSPCKFSGETTWEIIGNVLVNDIALISISEVCSELAHDMVRNPFRTAGYDECSIDDRVMVTNPNGEVTYREEYRDEFDVWYRIFFDKITKLKIV